MSVPRRWLARVLDETTQPMALPPSARAAATAAGSTTTTRTSESRTRARRVAAAMAAARGLTFGAPLLRPGQTLARAVDQLAPVVRLLATVADVVATVAAIADPGPPGSTSATQMTPEGLAPRTRAALAAACAVVFGDDDGEDARVLLHPTVAPAAREERATTEVERAIARRRYLLGDPLLGLTLHRALTAVDAHALVRIAVDAVTGAVPSDVDIAELRRGLARARLATTAAIAGLSEWRENVDADGVRQAALWQVQHLGLPRDEVVRLVEVVRRPPDLSRLVPLVPTAARGHVFRHTALAAAVDGRVSPDERRHLAALGAGLGLPPAAQARVRRRVLDFVRRHEDAFDPLALAAGFAAADPPWAVRVARAVLEDADALWREIRETGDLGVLLARRAAGQALTDDEQRRMRDQLIDVVKAVPALAVFALPGGFVLLPLLLKVLPFDIRTSAFRNKDDFHAFARDADDSLTPRPGAAPDEHQRRRRL